VARKRVKSVRDFIKNVHEVGRVEAEAIKTAISKETQIK